MADDDKKRIVRLVSGGRPEDMQDYAQDSAEPAPEPMVEADMDEISRPELDAKLEAVEARMDARIARIESLIESLRSETHSLKNWIMGTIVAVILASFSTVIGIYGANASIVQSVIAAFQAGQQSPPGKK